MTDRVAIVDGTTGPALDLVEVEGRAWAVVWPGIGASLRTMHRISLAADGRTRPQSHPAEAVYYVIEGSGSVAAGEAGEQLREGSMIHLGPNTEYVFNAAADGIELVGGPSPADLALYEGLDFEPPAPPGDSPATGSAADGVNPGLRVFHRDNPDRMLPIVASDARLIVWAGTGAETANMNFVDMKEGEQNVPHSHAFSEDTIFILSGQGTIADLDNDVIHEFSAGDVIHVPVGVKHQVVGNRGSSIVSVGGPCPCDVSLLRATGALD